MKYPLLLLFLTNIITVYCQHSPAGTKIRVADYVSLFDEESNNTAREIKSYAGKLYLFGQRFSKNNGIDYNSTVAIMDTSLNKLAEYNYGSSREDDKEIYSSFEIDASGNIYLAGTRSNTPILTKCDASGKQLWQKKYTIENVSALEKIVRDGDHLYTIGTGVGKGVASKAITIIKMDREGNMIWSTNVTESLYVFNLHVVQNKLIFVCSVLNSTIHDRIFIRSAVISKQGEVEWKRNFTSKESGLRQGTKYINSRVSKDQRSLLVFCNSQNPFIPDFGLLSVDTSGNISLLTSKSAEELNACKNDTDIFLCYDLYSAGPRKMFAKVVITEKYDFCLFEDTRYNLLDYVVIGGTRYFIGNVADQFSHWMVKKDR